jgi:hypothetical protein
LNALRNSASFSEEEKSLLADFLNRCDLIKFARYDATRADSQLLLEEALRFVKGDDLETAMERAARLQTSVANNDPTAAGDFARHDKVL